MPHGQVAWRLCLTVHKPGREVEFAQVILLSAMTEALGPEVAVQSHPGEQHQDVVHLQLLRRIYEQRHRVKARVGLRQQLAGHLRRQGKPVLVLLHLRTRTLESRAAFAPRGHKTPSSRQYPALTPSCC